MESCQPSAAPVVGDANSRLSLAQGPDTGSQALWQLIDDSNDLVANNARGRLQLALRPVHPVGAVHVPQIDPKTGRVIR
ncbi:hypothetical protein [Pseudarthrobacter sp. H2]|uniref:hypothetical protein n=1 Tax=Pseudarthrobacter sp. H2 TaxID=3418415 RepID=UPI003CF015B3